MQPRNDNFKVPYQPVSEENPTGPSAATQPSSMQKINETGERTTEEPELAGISGMLVVQIIKNSWRVAKAIGVTAGKILETYAGPLALGIIALRGTLQTLTALFDKNSDKRLTFGIGGLLSTGLAIMGILLMAAVIVAAPVILPCLFMGIVGVGFYLQEVKKSLIEEKITATTTEIEKNATRLKQLQANSARLIQQGLFTDEHPDAVEMRKLAVTNADLRNQNSTLNIELQYAQKKRYTNIAFVVAVALVIAGTFFPPLALVGVALFLGISVVNYVFKRTETKQKAALQKQLVTAEQVLAETRQNSAPAPALGLGKSLEHSQHHVSGNKITSHSPAVHSELEHSHSSSSTIADELHFSLHSTPDNDAFQQIDDEIKPQDQAEDPLLQKAASKEKESKEDRDRDGEGEGEKESGSENDEREENNNDEERPHLS